MTSFTSCDFCSAEAQWASKLHSELDDHYYDLCNVHSEEAVIYLKLHSKKKMKGGE